MATKIEWTSVTWNPVTGCTKISPGCRNCFAERMAKRLAGRGGYPKEQPFRVTLHPDKLEEPFYWHKPRMTFVCSMADLFHEAAVAFGYTDMVFETMTDCRAARHVFQILTKRPDEALEFLDDNPHFAPPDGWDHLWWGVTVEDQEQDWRIEKLLQIPAAVRFLSLEPLLGPVNLLPYFADIKCGQCGWLGYGDADTPDGGLAHEYNGPEDQDGHWECPTCGASEDGCVHDYSPVYNPFGDDPRLDWIIVGAETGPGRRWCDPQWMKDIVKQCHDAGVPVFVKTAHQPGPGKRPIVVKDINEIGTLLGAAPELLRQWPKGRLLGTFVRTPSPAPASPPAVPGPS